jgi:hypothetical protein
MTHTEYQKRKAECAGRAMYIVHWVVSGTPPTTDVLRVAKEVVQEDAALTEVVIKGLIDCD